MKQIGECNGGKVFYNGDGIVYVIHSSIMIVVKDEQDAIKKAEQNLIGFRRA